MATLDTTALIAVKFQESVVQTLDGKTFTHSIGDIICIPQYVNSIELNVATNVACMKELRSGIIPGFVVDEIRASA